MPQMRRLSLLLVLVMLVFAVPAIAEMAGSHDVYDLKSFNSTAADGSETRYRSAATFEKTLTFSSEGFDTNPLDRGVGTGSREMTMCIKPGSKKVVGGRTAWARFATDVHGTLHAEVASSYNVMLRIWKAPYQPAGQISRSSLTDVYCEDRRTGTATGEVSEVSPALQAGEVAIIETLGVCGEGATTATWEQVCTSGDGSAPAGSNQLKIRFVPDNADGDGVADPLDKCPGQPGTGEDGCAATATPTATPSPTATATPLGGLIATRVSAGFSRFATYSVVSRLVVRQASLPTRVRVTCRGRGCPRIRYDRTLRRTTSLRGLFRGRRLRGGAVVTVDLTAPGRIGRRYTYRIRTGRPALPGTACLTPSRTRIACP